METFVTLHDVYISLGIVSGILLALTTIDGENDFVRARGMFAGATVALLVLTLVTWL